MFVDFARFHNSTNHPPPTQPEEVNELMKSLYAKYHNKLIKSFTMRLRVAQF